MCIRDSLYITFCIGFSPTLTANQTTKQGNRTKDEENEFRKSFSKSFPQLLCSQQNLLFRKMPVNIVQYEHKRQSDEDLICGTKVVDGRTKQSHRRLYLLQLPI